MKDNPKLKKKRKYYLFDADKDESAPLAEVLGVPLWLSLSSPLLIKASPFSHLVCAGSSFKQGYSDLNLKIKCNVVFSCFRTSALCTSNRPTLPVKTVPCIQLELWGTTLIFSQDYNRSRDCTLFGVALMMSVISIKLFNVRWYLHLYE